MTLIPRAAMCKVVLGRKLESLQRFGVQEILERTEEDAGLMSELMIFSVYEGTSFLNSK